eukprot:6206922-Pleurochrysis_carterae.AAC.4
MSEKFAGLSTARPNLYSRHRTVWISSMRDDTLMRVRTCKRITASRAQHTNLALPTTSPQL